MKWSDVKKVKNRNCPNDGACRTVSKFLFFPKKIDHETRWLEKAKWIERFKYHRKTDPSFLNGVIFTVDVYKWQAVQWED